MKIAIWPIAKPVPYERNARRIPTSAVDKVAASIREFGWQQPIVVDKKGVIVVGHTRLLAAQKLGLKKVPVHIADQLTAAQVRAYRILDNRSNQESTWDIDLLGMEMIELGALGIDLGLTGFDPLEIAGFLQPTEGLTDPDEVPEVPAVPVTQPGDLWVLGRHRLLCGDATSAEDVTRLMAGEKANVVITSPPYASQREYDSSSGFQPVPADEYIDWYHSVAANLWAVLADDGSYFLNIKEHCEDGQRHLYVKDLTIAHVRQWGWRFIDEFCWNNSGVPKGPIARFKNQFEPIFHFSKQSNLKFNPQAVMIPTDRAFSKAGRGGVNATQGESDPLKGLARFDGKAYPGNVLFVNFDSHGGNGSGHCAMFPVGVPEFFLMAFSDIGDIVLDPFMGGGTTTIAAEKNARRAYGCEISANYCDVIVNRWEAFTGQKATREGEPQPKQRRKVKAA